MLKSLMENLQAMGCNPVAVDGVTVKINAPVINGLKMEINEKKYFIPPETLCDFVVEEEEKTK